MIINIPFLPFSYFHLKVEKVINTSGFTDRNFDKTYFIEFLNIIENDERTPLLEETNFRFLYFSKKYFGFCSYKGKRKRSNILNKASFIFYKLKDIKTKKFKNQVHNIMLLIHCSKSNSIFVVSPCFDVL